MENLLTDQERDALDEIHGGEVAIPRDIRSIDLVARDHLAFGMLPDLQGVGDRFGTAVGRDLSTAFRSPCVSQSKPVEIVSDTRVRELFQTSRFVYGLSIDKQKGQAAIAVDDLVAESYVVCHFGGTLEKGSIPEAAPTATQRRSVARLAKTLSESFAGALSQLVPINVDVDSSQTLPPGGRSLVSFEVAVNVGEIEGRIVLSLSTSAPCFKVQNESAEMDADAHDAHDVREQIARVPVAMTTILGRSLLPMKDVLSLKNGDVVTLDTVAGGDVEILIEGRRKFVGVPLISRGSLGVTLSGRAKGERQ